MLQGGYPKSLTIRGTWAPNPPKKYNTPNGQAPQGLGHPEDQPYGLGFGPPNLQYRLGLLLALSPLTSFLSPFFELCTLSYIYIRLFDA